ncbi:hypothetical protein OF83DRAFT_1058779 [Amylostereum chailletii]|nr:hypothetical protein OF83DRAFT_1058779 [Amylostereum chailletii]
MASQQITPSPLGVAAALASRSNPAVPVQPTLLNQLSQNDRVALVTGGNRGLGLESALALLEAGARVVYTIDLPVTPGEDWQAVDAYVKRLGLEGRLEYIRGDVTDQQQIWDIGQKIGDKEGRLDVCVAAAGITGPAMDCLEFMADTYKAVHDVNVNGVLYTAQAAGRQMQRFGTRGSIILFASIGGSSTFRGFPVIAYNTSKAAVLQLARSIACELAPKGIRVNALSPGYTYTPMTAQFMDAAPGVEETWAAVSPMGRLARPDEMRGAVAFLASDAASFCTGSE